MKQKAKGRSNQTIFVLISACIATTAMLTACNADNPKPTKVQSAEVAATTETPVLDGAALLETRCSVCHNADRPNKSKKTREQWDNTVSRMMRKGAKLTDAEKAVLLDYLAATYGQ